MTQCNHADDHHLRNTCPEIPRTDNQYNNFNYNLTQTQFRHASLHSHTADSTPDCFLSQHTWTPAVCTRWSVPAVNRAKICELVSSKQRSKRTWSWLPTKFTLPILLQKHIQMNGVFMAYCFVCHRCSGIHRSLKMLWYEELCYYKWDQGKFQTHGVHDLLRIIQIRCSLTGCCGHQLKGGWTVVKLCVMFRR